jgi:hypothetical protein
MVELLGQLDEEGTPQHLTLDLLQSEGYVPHVFDGTNFQVRRRGQRSQNIFLLNHAHIAKLRSSAGA